MSASRGSFPGCRSLTMLLALAAIASVAGGWTIARADVDPKTVFELEGDIVDQPSGCRNDWQNLNCSAFPPEACAPVPGTVTGVKTDPAPLSIFIGGSTKDAIDIPSWKHTEGSVPDKDNLIDAYAAAYNVPDTDGSNDQIIVLGGDRSAVNGDAFIGAWFFQNAVGENPNGSFSGKHRDGDLLILADFTKGGGVATPQVFEWIGGGTIDCVGSGGKPVSNVSTLCDITAKAATTATGISNGSSIAVPSSCRGRSSPPDDWNYVPKSGPAGTIPVNGFFEVGINTSALGGAIGQECFASFLLETRSSQSVDAVLKDYVLQNFQRCAMSCVKTANPTEECEQLETQSPVSYFYTVTNEGGGSLHVTLLDDNATPNDTSDDYKVCPPAAGGTCDTSKTSLCSSFVLAASESRTCSLPAGTLPPGTRVNKLHGSATESPTLTCDSSATVTINPTPTVAVTSLVCSPGATGFTLDACAGGGTPPLSYLWNTGATTSSVTSSAGGHYTVTVTDSKTCTASASQDVGYCSGSGPLSCGP